MPITLKAARVNAGMTQPEAAKALKIAKSTLANYEQQKTIPNMEIAKRMAKLYEIPMDELIFFAE